MVSALKGGRWTRQATVLAALVAFAVPACSSDTDKDGVPVVDLEGKIVNNQRMLTVKGKQMGQIEFLQTFCMAKHNNETCARVRRIARLDSISGPKRELPAGLVPGKSNAEPSPTPVAKGASSSGHVKMTAQERASAIEFLNTHCVVKTPRYAEDCVRTRRRLSTDSLYGTPPRF